MTENRASGKRGEKVDHGGSYTGAHVAGPGLDTSHGVILYVENVTVSFDGFKALDALTFYLDAGELRCLIGPNGAGKTTLMDVITGKTRPDTGTVFFGNNLDLTQMSEYQIALAGIGRKFQRPTVFHGHTVFENLELAMRTRKTVWTTLRAKLSGEQQDSISATAGTIGLLEHLDTRAGLLSHGQKQWLELGMLLMQAPQLLLVDEPVAGMTLQETERTAELLVSLAGKHTVLVVEHDMEFVRSLGHKVTVLHEGAVLAEGNMNDVQKDRRVVEVYLGE